MDDMRKAGLMNPLMLLVCWTGFIIAGTCVLVETTVQQGLAMNFPATKGRIIRSEMGRGTSSAAGWKLNTRMPLTACDTTVTATVTMITT